MSKHSRAAPRSHEVTAAASDIHELVRPGGILAHLVALLREPVADPTVGTRSHHKVSGSPAPWHVDVAVVYTDIHAGARRLENDLLEQLTGRRRRPPRGGSDDNTREALRSIEKLLAGVDPARQRDAAEEVASWLRAARRLRDIDTQETWSPLPRAPRATPPTCPYCQLFSLRMNRRAGEVRCMNRDCVDDDGERPVATMGVSGVLLFRDGYQVTYAAAADPDEQVS